MDRTIPKLGEREMDIMQALWEIGRATVTDVQTFLMSQGKDVAYTTVQTMLNRLEAKGRVARDISNRAHMYRPLLKKPRAAGKAIKELAGRFFNGSIEELATHLVKTDLSPESLDRIQTLIDLHRSKKGKP